MELITIKCFTLNEFNQQMKKLLLLFASLSLAAPLVASASEESFDVRETPEYKSRVDAAKYLGQASCISQISSPADYKKIMGETFLETVGATAKKERWLFTEDGSQAIKLFAYYYIGYKNCMPKLGLMPQVTQKELDKNIFPVLELLARGIRSKDEKEKDEKEKEVKEKEVKNKSPNLFQRIFPGKSKEEAPRDRCLKAADYEGCMKYETGPSNSGKVEQSTSESIETDPVVLRARRLNKGKDCTNRSACLGTGKEKDIFGLPTLRNYIYMQTPEDNKVFYSEEIPKDVKVRGQYGRYIGITIVQRYYQNPKAGTSGYSSGMGTASCTPGLGDSMDCTTTTFDIPGTPSTPAGIVQKKKYIIFDCQDQTMATYWASRVTTPKWTSSSGGSGGTKQWTQYCSDAGTGKLMKSDFKKLE